MKIEIIKIEQMFKAHKVIPHCKYKEVYIALSKLKDDESIKLTDISPTIANSIRTAVSLKHKKFYATSYHKETGELYFYIKPKDEVFNFNRTV